MKIQQIDTPKGKVWEVNGYLTYDDERVRVKKEDSRQKEVRNSGLIQN